MVVHNRYDEIEGGGFLGEMLQKFFLLFILGNKEEIFIIMSHNNDYC